MFERVVAEAGRGRLALVTDEPGRLAEAFPTPPLVFDAGRERWDLHAALAVAGRFDVVVLDVANPTARVRMIPDLLFHARAGGRLVVPDAARRPEAAAGAPAPAVDATSSPFLFVAAVTDPGSGIAPRPFGLRPVDITSLRSAMASVEFVDGHLVITNGHDVHAKLNEQAANTVIAATGRGRVLDSRPGVTWRPTAELRESESDLGGFWQREYAAPDLYLREYDDVLCLPGQVAVIDHFLLPDTYRHIGRPRLGNQYAPERAPLFAVPKDKRPARKVLNGPHFFWDSEFRGHFGHAVTEQLSRMWAFQRAREIHPGLKVVMAKNKHRELADFEVDLLGRFGVAREDLVFEYEPVRVEKLIAATPMFSQPNYIHPGITEVWDHLGASLAADAPDRAYPERFFVSRRHGKRSCRNGAEVEALFAAQGFEIVYPEDYSLAEQARLFREAKVIGGYAGSGLFNAMLALEPKHLIMVSSESYTAENEWMIAAARNHRIDVAWCVAEIPAPRGAYVVKAFHSPYTFDHEREGRFLAQVFAEL
ncbi:MULTISPECIES: glycosyltransferase family 61 protein [unclassified Nocardioides]|uniref:glycosyltransferase family 61 protein n=1 Tax=unclassified Nocardioides TaxID=2615069 RepID=UPI0006FA151D|nr:MULTISPECIES: glycosyltransferase 61 family protein [unclassified Nocardioides]KRA29958.1 hypothetical protein ASD81_19885 [Nocardioides sp. Root614]KRA86879.1 hypothetical protein ASD84_22100 [Nocardioides sp. Root682]